MKKATFYHAGCPVCLEAEHQIVDALDRQQFQIEKVHLGEMRNRIAEAERLGLRTLPALVIDSHVFHINHGADLAAIK